MRPSVRSDDYWTVYWDLTRDAKEALDRACLSEDEADEDAPDDAAGPAHAAPAAPPAPAPAAPRETQTA